MKRIYENSGHKKSPDFHRDFQFDLFVRPTLQISKHFFEDLQVLLQIVALKMRYLQ